MKKRLVLNALVTLAVIPASLAADKPCDPVQTSVPDPAGPEVKKVMQTLESKDADPITAHWIDGSFRYVAIKQDGIVKAHSVNTGLAFQSYAKAYDVFALTTGRPASNSALTSVTGTPAKNFDEAMKILKANVKSMSKDEILTYKSMVASALADCYDHEGMKTQNFENTFQNQKAGVNCGICGSIHEYLAKDASVIGFQSVGINSSIWQKTNDKGKSAEGHYTAFFKDPDKGTFYSQNYDKIIDTGMTTLQGAVDVTTQVWSPLVGVSYVESRPGVFHAYVPNTARWVEQQLSDPTHAQPAPLVTVEASNVANHVAVQFQKAGPDGSDQSRLNGFLVHSDYKADEGKYSLDAIGVAVTGKTKSTTALNGMVYEVQSRLYGGAMQTSAPNPLSGEKQTRSNLFFGVEQKASAKIDQVTGTLVVEGKSIDFRKLNNGFATLQIRPGVEWASPQAPVKVGIERTIDAVPRDSTQYGHPALRTAYDKISVIYDTSGKKNKAYLVAQGKIYAMEGITKNSATGVRAQLEAVIPAGNRGEFIVVADSSKITSNKAKDPFYDTPISTRLGITWRQAITNALKIGKTTEIGASFEISKNPRGNYLMSDEKDVVTPGSTTVEKGTRKVGMFWLRSQW
jgi:hypothetical protein